MQNYKTTKKLRGRRAEVTKQISICLVLTHKQYLFNINFGKNDLNCIQWIYLVLQITTSQICMFLYKYSVSIHPSMWIYLILHVTLIKYGTTSSKETFGISNSEITKMVLSGFADHILI